MLGRGARADDEIAPAAAPPTFASRSETPLTTSLPHRCFSLLAATALALATIAALLASPGIAAERKTSCSSHAHARHGAAPACTGTAHGHKARGRHANRGYTGVHGATSTRGPTGPAPAAAAGTPATCEDGADASVNHQGSLSCADASQPTCQDGSSPRRSTSGHTTLCPAPTVEGAQDGCEGLAESPCDVSSEEPASATQGTCQEGSAPLPGGEVSFSCSA
jgi:hypothetical protein